VRNASQKQPECVFDQDLTPKAAWERKRHRTGRPSEGSSLTKWCEENGLLGGATSRAQKLSGGATFRVVFRCGGGVCLRVRSRLFLAEDPGSGGLSARSIPAGLLTSGRIIPTGRHCHRVHSEDRSWWKTSRELAGSARSLSVRVLAKSLERRPLGLFETLRAKRRRDGPGKPGLRYAGTALERRKTPMRASACTGRGPPQVRTSVGSKVLELRGIVNSWSSEQEHAMPETARGQRR
jgi:hypothetical protein